MGKVLSVYAAKAFKEFILPSINDLDYTVTLHKNIFGLKEDLVMQLEVVENEWKFVSDNAYHVKKDDVLYENKTLADGDLLKIYVEGREALSIIVKDVAYTFAVYEKFEIKDQSTITIGKNENNIIQYDYQNFVSKNHAEIVFKEGAWIIQNKSVNGVYVNAGRIQESCILHFGDYINVVGLHMVFLNHVLAVDTTNPFVIVNRNILPIWSNGNDEETIAIANSTGKKLFHRSPRSIQKIETGPIKIEKPPNPEKPEPMPLMMTIGPSFTMAFPMLLSCFLMIYSSRSSGASSGIYMYTGLIMAVSSAGLGVFWTLANLSHHKKKLKEKEIHRFDAYSQYLLKKTNEIKEKYEHNLFALKERYLDSSECIKYTADTAKLWNRNSIHSDFLTHRLGLGDLPFQVPIQVPEEGFSLLEDSLSDKPQFILNNYKTLFHVPITVNLLKHNVIGVIGGKDKKGSLEIAKLLALQIAANNCYTDVKLVFSYDQAASADYQQWEYARWLPHVWSEDHKIRFVASNKNEASDVFYELTRIFRQRQEQANSQKEKGYKPYFVVFISDPSILEGELLTKYIFSEEINYGLTTIILSESKEELPNSCQYIIENTEEFKGMYDFMAGEDERCPVAFDQIDYNELCEFSRRMSDIEVQEVEEGGELPGTLTFFDMYHVNSLEEFQVLDRWRKNRTYDNIKGLIGEKAGGKPCYLDVHEKYHGPHGLVAGTTGSGKSETLQTYMLSLALNYSPDDISYFIIDYKGGGMANLFNGLPHLIGQISNLSGNQVHRAMVSIKSENRRRQQIFNENGVNNINLYTKLYKNGEASLPVPHLFIIIDEFAELKREEPDFMRELISVAQVGRSLGVHLILATQKPSGTVDDSIWSNSKFRLCLRVQDKQDSMDMLHKADAAYIIQAGRCYLQVGNDEVYELFQSGYSGAVYIEDEMAGKTEIARLLSTTGRADLTGGYIKTMQKEKVLRDWLSTLQECLVQVLNASKKSPNDYFKQNGVKYLIDEMYVQMEARDIDYPRSSYNEKRLRDFIHVYAKAAAEGGNVISNILRIASAGSVKLPQAKEKTQLDAVKEYLAQAAAENGYNHNLQLWMPVLKEQLYLDEFQEYKEESFDGGSWAEPSKNWSLRVLMGKVDDPQNQSQMPLFIDISEHGHLAVCGSVVSGKSTFLQTYIYGLITGYTPDYVTVYALDFSSKMMSAFEEAAHVGGIMYENDLEKIAKFFTMMKDILKERKEIFHGGNYSQYVKVNGVSLPSIFIVIDNFSGFNEKTEEKYEDLLIQLSKEGVSHGIYLIISGGGFGRTEIPNRVAENIMDTITLQLPDKFAYAEIMRTSQFDVIPEIGVKGRGLANFGNRILEFQTALAAEASDDYQRLEIIQKKCRELNAAWNGKHAKPIPQIPDKPVWPEFAALEETVKMSEDVARLPAGYDATNASIYGVNLRNCYCYLIMGGLRSGKKNYMRVLIESALMKEANVCILDTAQKFLHTYENREGLTYLNGDEEIFRYFQSLIPVFKERNQQKHQLTAQDYDEDELYDVMSKEIPYFIFITDLSSFISMLNHSKFEMKGFLENILEKGRLHHIYFFALLNLKDRSELVSSTIFQLFCDYKTGIHFGGNVTENTVLNFDHLNYREQSEKYKAGIGILSGPLYQEDTARIVVPLVKGRKND